MKSYLKMVDSSEVMKDHTHTYCIYVLVTVRDGHGGGWSRKINAWHLYTLMVYL